MSDVTITTYEGTEISEETFGYTVTVAEGGVLHPVPAGGTTGQALVKVSDADHDYDWDDVVGSGGSTVTVDADGTVTVDATTVELATDAQLTAHEADTTNVHGIANTALLETTTGAQAKADAAQDAAEATADAALAAHEAAANPHPVYLTAAEGNATYDVLGAAAAAQAAAIAAAAADATTKANAAEADAAAYTDSEIADEVTARNAAISTAVANLIDSAPGALDTLNELAAALGDDPNFATTITNALAGKQPLDADLTALAALTTTAYGRAFLELANQAALVALLPSYQPLDADLTAIAALSTTAFGRSLLEGADASSIKTLLALVKADVGLSNVDNTSDANKPVSTATQTALDAKVPIARTINAQTGTSYTLVLADAGKKVTMSNASASTLTVPPNSSVAFPTGTQIEFAQLGAGAVTVTPGSGVTISGTPDLIASQYQGGTLTKTGTDTWLCEWSADSSGGGGGGASWTLAIDDALSATTNLRTATSGTWGINAGVLRQSSTAASVSRIAHATVPSPQGILAGSVEVAYSSSSGGTRRIGIITRHSDTGSLNTSYYLESGDGTTWTARVENDAEALVASTSCSYNGSGYATMRFIQTGDTTELYLGTTFLISVANNRTPYSGGHKYVGLYTYNCVADFRNLKAWTLLTVPW